MNEDIDLLMKESVSEKRYIHCVGVAQTTAEVLDRYNCTEYTKSWNGYNAAYFCGMIHDLAREVPEDRMLEYCSENSVEVTEEERKSPMILHGKVAVSMIERRLGRIPDDWANAIRFHTTGAGKMDELALALFISDYIEPSRPFLDEKKRQEYLSCCSIEECAYAILNDMIAHWKSKSFFVISNDSIKMKLDLEERLKCVKH